MKATELRIGNYINYGTQVTGITEKTIYVSPVGKYKITSYRNNQIKPIPLTEQWLKDFGFEEKALRVFYIDINGLKLGIKLTSDNDGILMIQNFGRFDLGLNKEIKYVHQLQNLYFALTGKELTKT